MKEKFTIVIDEKIKIVAYRWMNPLVKTIGCIQIFHGMAENILRYEEMVNYFIEKGFIVIGHDHYAHGESEPKLQNIDPKDDFLQTILKTMKFVHDYFGENFKNYPSLMFAHSMGSMAAQRYIQLYPQDFTKVVLSGTDIGGGKYTFAKNLFKLWIQPHKITYSKFVLSMTTGGFNKKFKKEHPKYGWLSKNKKNIENYEKNSFCGEDFPTNYFYSLSKLMCENVKKRNLEQINKDLKLLIYCGKEDPVANFGKSIIKLKKLYQNYQLCVETLIIENARHEVHNENETIKFNLFKTIESFYKS